MRGSLLWSHDYYSSFFSFASYWSYATGIDINLQRKNKKIICEFPVIFLKIMVHSDLGSVQKLRHHLVDAKKINYVKNKIFNIIFQLDEVWLDEVWSFSNFRFCLFISLVHFNQWLFVCAKESSSVIGDSVFISFQNYTVISGI